MPEEKPKKMKTIEEIVKDAERRKQLPELTENLRRNIEKARLSEEEIRETYKKIPKEKYKGYRWITRRIEIEPNIQNIVTLHLQEKVIVRKIDIKEFLEYLNEQISRKTSGTFVYIDSSYLMDAAKAKLNIEKVLRTLREDLQEKLGENFEIIFTRQVYDEVKKAIGQKDEKGRPLFTSERLSELHNAIHGTKENPPVVSLEEVDLKPTIVEDLSKFLQEKSEDRNKRIGEGESSVFQLMFSCDGEFDHIILSSDSDVRRLYKKVYTSIEI